ncbi:MAG TPA: site-specific integrase [Allosphingosinicella sp.]|jgi:integrase
MASVRKREWVAPSGEKRSAWQVDYKDSFGNRRSKQFKRKKDADAWRVEASWEVTQGTHTPDSQSITVAEAAQLWLARCQAEDLEPTTIAAYEQQARLHLLPLCGNMKLSQLNRPRIEKLRDDLLASRSRSMAARVMRAFTAVIKEAQRQGKVSQNVSEGVRVKRSKREKRVVIPSKDDLRLLLSAASASEDTAAAALVALVTFCGLRASELRGLPWRDVDLRKGTVIVSQRADSRNVIGAAKSASGFRTIPMPPLVQSLLRKWKLACPPTDLNLVFPSIAGAVMSHRYMTLNLLDRLQCSAGLFSAAPPNDRQPLCKAGGQEGRERGRYTLHDFRHAAASLWIEQRVSPKRVQTWMGHSSIQVTFDVYGHLFSDADRDAAVAAAVECDLLNGGEGATRMRQEVRKPRKTVSEN